MRQPFPQPRPRSGTAATEFALVAPVLLLLTFGTVDFARVMHTSIALANAARAGVDYGASHRFTAVNEALWEARVIDRVREEMAADPDFDPSELSVIVTTIATASGLDVQVEATYRFQTVVMWPGLPNDLQLRESVVGGRYR